MQTARMFARLGFRRPPFGVATRKNLYALGNQHKSPLRFDGGQARRAITTFHMDNTFRGRMQPYIPAIKLISSLAGLVVLGVGGFYLVLNNYIDQKWPVSEEIKRKETRKLLRGASMREHIAPNPQIAYMFLLRALEQIYEDGQLSQESPEVQEIIVRLANAASKMGESGPAEEMLRDAWNNVVDGQGSPVSSPVLVAKDGLVVAYEEKWRDEQIGRIAQVLGPLLIDRGDHQASIRTFGAALQAIKRLENRLDKAKEDADQDVAKEVDGLHLKQANFVTSLGEAFALAGDSKTAKALLESVLVDIRKRGDEHSSKAVDEWTCLDAIVMLDLAQVCNNMGEKDDSLAWANSALGITQENKGVRACDNCQEHLLRHIAQFADTSKEASMDH